MRGREGNNLLVHACGTNSLCFFSFGFFFSFFVFRFSSYLSFFFFLSYYFLFLFLDFSSFQSYPFPYRRCCYCTQQGLLFIVPTLTGFYFFGPYLPLSGLGVLADHHICVPLPITRQRGLFCLLVFRGTSFPLQCGCLLSPYPSWHAPSGPTQFCPFGWCVIPARHFT